MKKYFATLDTNDIGSELVSRIESWDRSLLTSGRTQLWKKSHETYYKSAITGGKLRKTGDQDEFTNVNVNHYRNLLQHLLGMITQQRPSFDPRAANTDVKSQSQTILAGGLLEYYSRQKNMERYVKQAVEFSLILGEGFVSTGWAAESGQVYGVNPDTGAEIYEGDLFFNVHTPQDVIRDFEKTDSYSNDWLIVRSYKNRYSLASKYPELSDRILNISTTRDIKRKSRSDESDDIAHYIFYHKPTPTLPEGRLVEFLDSDVVLVDSPLPYRNIPVYRIAPDEQTGTPFGYTVGFDLLPIQESLDNLYSIVLTNQSTFGVQNIMAPRGHNMSAQQLSGGLNLIEYDAATGAPSALNLTSTPPEIFSFMQQLERLSETISGVNSVARGNPESSLKSGTALALVQSMAVQFSTGLQQSYAQLLEDLATAVVYILRDFATVPRIAAIVGKANRSYMKDFTGDDLSEINRVHVDLGNPLTRTIAGRVNLAETLMQNGMVKNPEQYIQVMTTGRLEPIIEGAQAELLLIRSENERLADGIQVLAAITDNHLQHIEEHKVVIASPEARDNPEIMKATLAHIREHLDILSNPANAQMLSVLGQQPIAPVRPPEASPLLNATGPLQQEAANVRLPSLPNPPPGTDPQTAQIIEEQKSLALNS